MCVCVSPAYTARSVHKRVLLLWAATGHTIGGNNYKRVRTSAPFIIMVTVIVVIICGYYRRANTLHTGVRGSYTLGRATSSSSAGVRRAERRTRKKKNKTKNYNNKRKYLRILPGQWTGREGFRRQRADFKNDCATNNVCRPINTVFDTVAVLDKFQWIRQKNIFTGVSCFPSTKGNKEVFTEKQKKRHF